jgi:hypothetical protein
MSFPKNEVIGFLAQVWRHMFLCRVSCKTPPPTPTPQRGKYLPRPVIVPSYSTYFPAGIQCAKPSPPPSWKLAQLPAESITAVLVSRGFVSFLHISGFVKHFSHFSDAIANKHVAQSSDNLSWTGALSVTVCWLRNKLPEERRNNQYEGSQGLCYMYYCTYLPLLVSVVDVHTFFPSTDSL